MKRPESDLNDEEGIEEEIKDLQGDNARKADSSELKPREQVEDVENYCDEESAESETDEEYVPGEEVPEEPESDLSEEEKLHKELRLLKKDAAKSLEIVSKKEYILGEDSEETSSSESDGEEIFEEDSDDEYIPAEDSEDTESEESCQSEDVQLCKDFVKFLKHPDGGRKQAREANQIVTRVVNLIVILKAANDINKMFDGDLLWEAFVQKQLDAFTQKKKCLSPKTLKVYLLAVERFAEFMLRDNPSNKQILSLKNRLPSWRKSIKLECTIQTEKKYHDDLKRMPGKECVKQVLECETSQEAKKTLKGLANGDPVSC